MGSVINSKGRVIIPPEIRKQLGIKDGTRLQIDMNVAKGQIIITPITREYIHSLRGKYKGRGLMKAFMTEKASEK